MQGQRTKQKTPPWKGDPRPEEEGKLNEMLRNDSLSIDFAQLRDLIISSDKADDDAITEIDELPWKDLLKLSQQERNAINEEIHGVKNNVCPEETPGMIDDALRRFAAHLEGMPDAEIEKSAYLRKRREREGGTGGGITNTANNTTVYTETDEWRLRFLRCDLFDAEKAATRMVKFLTILSDIFGEHVLDRPLRITDFSRAEMNAFRRGHQQLLPFRDRSGRRVFTVVGGFDLATPLEIRVSFFFSLCVLSVNIYICVCVMVDAVGP